MNNTPRVLLAGVSSGCGKTTAVCAVLQALVDRGLRVGAFKCGPDYIDPMFHSRIIGAKSGNLDLHFFSENTARFLLAKNAADRDVSVIEGVMGYYDGLGLTSSRASSYEVAQVTRTPAVLVVNAKGASLSVLAVIKGFLDFRPEPNIRGVLLNQCSAMAYPRPGGGNRGPAGRQMLRLPAQNGGRRPGEPPPGAGDGGRGGGPEGKNGPAGRPGGKNH